MPWVRSVARATGWPPYLPAAKEPFSAIATAPPCGICAIRPAPPSTSRCRELSGVRASGLRSTQPGSSTQPTAPRWRASPSPRSPARCSTWPRSYPPPSSAAPTRRRNGTRSSMQGQCTSYSTARTGAADSLPSLPCSTTTQQSQPSRNRTSSPPSSTWSAAGLPLPQLNVLVDGYLVDAYWPQARLVVELQSYQHHAHRQAFDRDYAKLGRLRLGGYEVLPLTHRQVTEEADWVVGALRSLLRRQSNGVVVARRAVPLANV
jgi:Protein of unknown function (DUF559)